MDELVMEVRAALDVPARRARAADPDATLVSAALEEPRAFFALYDRYFQRVLGYTRLRIRDQATCEDVTSTIFTTALAQLPRFRGDGSFAGWLFQIARNAIRDVQRKRVAESLPMEIAGSEPDVEERFLAHERAEELRAVIRLLDPEQQHLLALRFGAGLAFDEIGAVVGAGPGTVRVRLHRILEELRRRYPHDD
jgi:RNA polymerase sigma-70 factor, ECF subfamily